MEWTWLNGQPRERGRFQYTNIGANSDLAIFREGQCFRVTQGYPAGARVAAVSFDPAGALHVLVESDTVEECDVATVPTMPVPACVTWTPSPEEIAAEACRRPVVDAVEPVSEPQEAGEPVVEDKLAAPEAE